MLVGRACALGYGLAMQCNIDAQGKAVRLIWGLVMQAAAIALAGLISFIDALDALCHGGPRELRTNPDRPGRDEPCVIKPH